VPPVPGAFQFTRFIFLKLNYQIANNRQRVINSPPKKDSETSVFLSQVQTTKSNYRESMTTDNEENGLNDKAENEFRKELWGLLKSSYQQYDKAIIALSTGALGFSITVIKDIFPLKEIVYPGSLVTSWACFTCAILFTVSSFVTSQHAIRKDCEDFEKSVREDEEFRVDNPNKFANATQVLNWLSGGVFVVGVLAMTIFCGINFLARWENVRGKGTGLELPRTAESTTTSKTTCYKAYSSSTTKRTRSISIAERRNHTSERRIKSQMATHGASTGCYEKQTPIVVNCTTCPDSTSQDVLKSDVVIH